SIASHRSSSGERFQRSQCGQTTHSRPLAASNARRLPTGNVSSVSLAPSALLQKRQVAYMSFHITRDERQSVGATTPAGGGRVAKLLGAAIGSRTRRRPRRRRPAPRVVFASREGLMSTATAADPVTSRKPRDDEIDVWGLTHPGKVRKSNQDHFLLGSLHKRLEILASSLPAAEQLRACDERIGFLAMIADGVGGRAAGEEASRLALEQVTMYVAQSTRCYYEYNSQADDFTDMLQAAALKSHERVLEHAQSY